MNKQRIAAWLRLFLFTLFLGLTVLIYIKYGKQITVYITNMDMLEDFFNRLGRFGVPAFIALQIAQVIIAFLPGEIVQFASGYIFGIWLGTFVSVIGILIGTIIVFFISHSLGYPALKNYMQPERLEKWQELLKSKQAGWVVFFLFLIPGLPKTFITYAGGISPITWYNFIPQAMLGRFPAIFVSSIIGANIYDGNYLQAALLLLTAVILLIPLLLYRKQLVYYVQQKLKTN